MAEFPGGVDGISTVRAMLGGAGWIDAHKSLILFAFSPFENFADAHGSERVILLRDGVDLERFVPNTVVAYCVVLVGLASPFFEVDFFSDVDWTTAEASHSRSDYFG